ncbi:hypothetical protein Y032_0317g2327 [Ancylostoma ceylanicum]|uniref:Uncharacterized protein n=1 Tax=Ancylostoma ceylanicum TaxID=53326 RepID=A0A016S255_9BILA|nr:hypothetical protein Y032_0317g2327 [Ancylostoma ceylanicum]
MWKRPLWKSGAQKNQGLVHWQHSKRQVTIEVDPISALLNVFNGTGYDGGLGEFKTWEEQCDSLRRCEQGPIQQFAWVEVREVPDIGGRGVYAKVPIPHGSILPDYRGSTLAYSLKYEVHVGSAPVTNVVMAYELTYKGVVVLGRRTAIFTPIYSSTFINT